MTVGAGIAAPQVWVCSSFWTSRLRSGSLGATRISPELAHSVPSARTLTKPLLELAAREASEMGMSSLAQVATRLARE